MKNLFGILLSLLLITACRNEPSNLDKTLFILDYHNCVYLRENRHYYFNVDSILEQIDLSKYQHEDSIVRILLMIPNSFLDSICTDEQLKELVYAKNHSAAVRVTAFKALASRGYNGLEKMVLDNYKDTAKLSVGGGDYFRKEHAGSMFLTYAAGARSRGYISVQDSLMNDSLALFTPDIPLYDFLKDKLREIPPSDDAHYNRIRELYIKEPCEELLMALARYHKTDDLEFIAAELENFNLEEPHIESALSAIAVWPHPFFKKKLEKLRDAIIAGKLGSGIREVDRFIKAVMAYDYSWAHQFLDTSLALESKAPKKKYQVLIVDEFHSTYGIKIPMDLIKKYPSKHCNCLYHDGGNE
jgi:hypothetical protein